MTKSWLPSENKITCQICLADLADYVHLELDDQLAEQIYPLVAFHLESCSACQKAYYREFRRQGEAYTLPVTQQIRTQLPQVAAAIPLPANPNWVAQTLDQGRAWLEAETDRWRQVLLSLSSLSSLVGEQLGGGGGLEPAPLTGLMGDIEVSSLADKGEQGVQHIAPPEANLELRLHLKSDPSPGNEELYALDVGVILKDRFGDFSGTQVTLLWASQAYVKETDPMGKVSFTSLPREELAAMRLVVTLPD